MFARRVKLQLGVFAVLTAAALAVVSVTYLDLPRLLGYRQYPITVEFRDATGLYPSGQVMYRGTPVGKITAVTVGGRAARVETAINDDVRIPADVRVEAHSASAAGEQFVELLPQGSGPPFVDPGSTIPAAQAQGLPRTDELLERVTRLAKSVPPDQLHTLMTETAAAFRGGAGEWQQLLSGARSLVSDARANIRPTVELLQGAEPFLGTQQAISGDMRQSFRGLAGITDQLRADDPTIRGVLRGTPPATEAITGTIDDIRGDLPALLSDLTTTGQVVKTYLPGAEQVLVLYPAVTAALQGALLPPGADPGSVHLELRPNISQPPNCLDGFLPISQQRDYNDESTRASIPPNLHCDVPHGDPRAVRGSRNTPCLNAPGRREASVEECLGAQPGTISDPVPAATAGPRTVVGTYDPHSGRAATPDGGVLTLGRGSGPDDGKEITSWQQLLLK